MNEKFFIKQIVNDWCVCVGNHSPIQLFSQLPNAIVAKDILEHDSENKIHKISHDGSFDKLGKMFDIEKEQNIDMYTVFSVENYLFNKKENAIIFSKLIGLDFDCYF